MASKDQSAEDILKDLHDNDGSDDDASDDEDIDLTKLKEQSKAAKETTKADPLSEEKQRHKDTLMKDLYD